MPSCQPATAMAMIAAPARPRRIPTGTGPLRELVGAISVCLFSLGTAVAVVVRGPNGSCRERHQARTLSDLRSRQTSSTPRRTATRDNSHCRTDYDRNFERGTREPHRQPTSTARTTVLVVNRSQHAQTPHRQDQYSSAPWATITDLADVRNMHVCALHRPEFQFSVVYWLPSVGTTLVE